MSRVPPPPDELEMAMWKFGQDVDGAEDASSEIDDGGGVQLVESAASSVQNRSPYPSSSQKDQDLPNISPKSTAKQAAEESPRRGRRKIQIITTSSYGRRFVRSSLFDQPPSRDQRRGQYRTPRFARSLRPQPRTRQIAQPALPAKRRNEPPRISTEEAAYVTPPAYTFPNYNPIHCSLRTPILEPEAKPWAKDGQKLAKLKFFHYFFGFPPNVRHRIWYFALPGPRMVTLTHGFSKARRSYEQVFVAPAEFIKTESQIIPKALKAVLQTCQDSRVVALAYYCPILPGIFQKKPIFFNFMRDTLVLPSLDALENLTWKPQPYERNDFTKQTLYTVHTSLRHVMFRSAVPLELDYTPDHRLLKMISMFWRLESVTLTLEHPRWEDRFVEAQDPISEAEAWKGNMAESITRQVLNFRDVYPEWAYTKLPVVEFKTTREMDIMIDCQKNGEDKVFTGPHVFVPPGRQRPKRNRANGMVLDN